ncbi:alpha-mannosidase 2-like [Lineus longissimus]|uniref:alpha-mannosidase 2-like n=1 Tax=Lineus longissimus TaxID=88925 RepID=UPI00315CB991
MKFPFRVLSIIISMVFLTIILLVFVDFKDSIDVHPRNWDFQEQVRKTVKGDIQECRFADNVIPSKGIDTHVLFDKVHKQDASMIEPETKGGNEKVTVFLVPHSHTDPGWLMTVDEYYKELTKNILDNLVIKMAQYPDVKFVWGETVFLAIWWKDITEEVKEKFKALVHSGRVEIINGGWVAPDEAVTHYYAIIDQLMEGHQWVEKYLGVKAKVGWSPDPFGYSATMPYLLNRAGMQDMVILRIHDHIKQRLRRERNLETHWRQPWDLHTNSTDTFCHIMPYILYNFKYSCGPIPYVCNKFDFRKVPGKNGDNQPPSLGKDNIAGYAKMLAGAFRQKAQVFRHNAVFHAMGDDFRYDTALEWDEQIANYTMLKDHINQQKDWNMEVKFGTLTDYFNAIKQTERNKQLRGKFPVLHGDFFPYLDMGSSYWTGFYTTRPFWKQLGREVEGNLRTAEILNSLAVGYTSMYGRPYNADANLKSLSEARLHLATFQHHDAITGTSKPHTVKDYERRLWRAKRLSHKVSSSAAAYLFSKGKVAPLDLPAHYLYPDDGRSDDSPLQLKTPINTQDSLAKVCVFNPVPKIRHELIRLVVNNTDVTVFDINEEPVMSQISPVWENRTTVSNHKFELLFYTTLPPLGMVTFTIRPILNNRYTKKAKLSCTKPTLKECAISPGKFFISLTPNPNRIEIKNSHFVATFDGKGALTTLRNSGAKKTLIISPSFLQYDSAGSGAYIFYPSQKHSSLFMEPDTVVHVEGALLSEMRMAQGILEHSVRVFHTNNTQGAALEIENCLDMTGTKNNKEIFMRFETTVKNKDVMFTDSNGYQMILRKRKDSFNIAGNFFPMATMCYIEDDWMRLSVLAGQPHGVASLKQGLLDVMLDRKLFSDDYRGLEEGVVDNRKTRTTFLLLLEQNKRIYDNDDDEDAKVLSYPSLLGTTLTDYLLRPVTNFIVHEPLALLQTFFPLRSPLPCDVDIVNLKTLVDKVNDHLDVVLILHRRGFQCYFETSDINCPMTGGDVSLNGMFESMKITSMKEVTLSLMYEKRARDPNEHVHLHPMEIVTYRLQFV